MTRRPRHPGRRSKTPWHQGLGATKALELLYGHQKKGLPTMSQVSVSLGRGLDRVNALVECFSDFNPPDEIRDLGPLVLRFTLDGDNWIRFMPPPDCACNGKGLNEIHQPCTVCLLPTMKTIHESGEHPQLRSIEVSEDHRGKKIPRPYAIIDLQPKSKPQKESKTKKDQKED